MMSATRAAAADSSVVPTEITSREPALTARMNPWNESVAENPPFPGAATFVRSRAFARNDSYRARAAAAAASLSNGTTSAVAGSPACSYFASKAFVNTAWPRASAGMNLTESGTWPAAGNQPTSAGMAPGDPSPFAMAAPSASSSRCLPPPGGVVSLT